MNHVRLVVPALALAVTLAVTTMIGSGQQPPGAMVGGPFDSLHFRPIGPASMSGRISDLAVFEPSA